MRKLLPWLTGGGLLIAVAHSAVYDSLKAASITVYEWFTSETKTFRFDAGETAACEPGHVGRIVENAFDDGFLCTTQEESCKPKSTAKNTWLCADFSVRDISYAGFFEELAREFPGCFERNFEASDQKVFDVVTGSQAICTTGLRKEAGVWKPAGNAVSWIICLGDHPSAKDPPVSATKASTTAEPRSCAAKELRKHGFPAQRSAIVSQ